MPVRSLFAAVEAFKSRMLHTWVPGWSVPIDEVFVSARLLSRHVDATGGVAEPWLRMAARSAAVKWRGEVCGVHRGRVRSVMIVAGRPQLAQIEVRGAVHVTARYCGQVSEGSFCFRHGLYDVSGSEILHFVSQVYFSPRPDLPVYPALKLDVGDGSGDLHQAVMRSTMAESALCGDDLAEKTMNVSIDVKPHPAASGAVQESVRIQLNSTVAQSRAQS
jgi:hypothetical protein